ncbi:MAG: hypothetical protein HONBIEJF_00377 [Fimbriimonadaceae bacterium]|nr:hypothetical protein [Fimbriimonadaceae bacterium]
MKLVRFDLTASPGQVRSGIYYDNRIYETNGNQPVGIHDLSKLTLLAPLGSPPSVRRFSPLADGGLAYEFLNPTILRGPLAEIDAPDFTRDLAPELSLGIIVSDAGEMIDETEAPGFILGFTVVAVLVAEDLREEERKLGLGPGRSSDIGIVVGPFLTTPDELDEEGGWQNRDWTATLRIGQGDTLATPLTAPIIEMLITASRNAPLQAGEVLLTPPARLPASPLMPADHVVAGIAGLGDLHFSVI